MASRQFRSGVSLGSLVPNMRILCGTTDGSTESINGVSAVTNPGTGLYKLALEDKYVALVCVQGSVQKSGGVAKWVQVDSHDVTSSTPYVQVVIVDATGAPTALASGETVHVHITLRDSTVTI